MTACFGKLFNVIKPRSIGTIRCDYAPYCVKIILNWYRQKVPLKNKIWMPSTLIYGSCHSHMRICSAIINPNCIWPCFIDYARMDLGCTCPWCIGSARMDLGYTCPWCIGSVRMDLGCTCPWCIGNARMDSRCTCPLCIGSARMDTGCTCP